MPNLNSDEILKKLNPPKKLKPAQDYTLIKNNENRQYSRNPTPTKNTTSNPTPLQDNYLLTQEHSIEENPIFKTNEDTIEDLFNSGKIIQKKQQASRLPISNENTSNDHGFIPVNQPNQRQNNSTDSKIITIKKGDILSQRILEELQNQNFLENIEGNINKVLYGDKTSKDPEIKLGLAKLIARQNGLESANQIVPGQNLIINFNNKILKPYETYNVNSKNNFVEEQESIHTVRNGEDLGTLIALYYAEIGLPTNQKMLWSDKLVEEYSEHIGVKNPNQLIPGQKLIFNKKNMNTLYEKIKNKNYEKSKQTIGSKYSLGESASSIAKDYALEEFTNLNNIRKMGTKYAKENGITLKRFNSKNYDFNAYVWLSQKYEELGDYKLVIKATQEAPELNTKVSERTIRRARKLALI